DLTVGDEHGNPVRVLVHVRLFFRPIRDLQHAHLVVFEHHLVVLRVYYGGILTNSRTSHESSHRARDQQAHLPHTFPPHCCPLSESRPGYPISPSSSRRVSSNTIVLKESGNVQGVPPPDHN